MYGRYTQNVRKPEKPVIWDRRNELKQCCSKNLQNGKNIAFVMLFCKIFQPRETKSELR